MVQDQAGRGLTWVSCDVDLEHMVVCAGEHQDLLRLAGVEHLARAEGLESWHGKSPLLLLVTAHRVNASPAAQTGRVSLLLQALIQKREVVVL